MTTIENISDQSPQQMTIVLPDGSALTITFTYKAQQSGWFWDASWNGQNPPWQRNGQRLCTSPNFLRQERNVIPFGLALSTTDGSEPTGQEDFQSGKATLVLLDATDVINVENGFFAKLD